MNHLTYTHKLCLGKNYPKSIYIQVVNRLAMSYPMFNKWIVPVFFILTHLYKRVVFMSCVLMSQVKDAIYFEL